MPQDSAFRQRVKRFYAHYAPEKVETLKPAVFERFEKDGEAGEKKFIASLMKKYGPEPGTPEFVAANSKLAPETEDSPFRQRVKRFYAHYAPEKVETLKPSVFERFEKDGEAGEKKFIASLMKKYGPEPGTPEFVAANGGGDGEVVIAAAAQQAEEGIDTRGVQMHQSANDDEQQKQQQQQEIQQPEAAANPNIPLTATLSDGDILGGDNDGDGDRAVAGGAIATTTTTTTEGGTTGSGDATTTGGGATVVVGEQPPQSPPPPPQTSNTNTYSTTNGGAVYTYDPNASSPTLPAANTEDKTNKFNEFKVNLEASSPNRAKNRATKTVDATSYRKGNLGTVSYTDMNNDFFNPAHIVTQNGDIINGETGMPVSSHHAHAQSRTLNVDGVKFDLGGGSGGGDATTNGMSGSGGGAQQQDQGALVQALLVALQQQQQQNQQQINRGLNNGPSPMYTIGGGIQDNNNQQQQANNSAMTGGNNNNTIVVQQGGGGDLRKQNSDHDLVPGGDGAEGGGGYPRVIYQNNKHIGGMIDTKHQDDFVFNIMTKAKVQRSLFDSNNHGGRTTAADGSAAGAGDFDGPNEHPKNIAHREMIKEKERLIKLEGLMEKRIQDNLYKPLNYPSYLTNTNGTNGGGENSNIHQHMSSARNSGAAGRSPSTPSSSPWRGQGQQGHQSPPNNRVRDVVLNNIDNILGLPAPGPGPQVTNSSFGAGSTSRVPPSSSGFQSFFDNVQSMPQHERNPFDDLKTFTQSPQSFIYNHNTATSDNGAYGRQSSSNNRAFDVPPQHQPQTTTKVGGLPGMRCVEL